MRVETIVPSMAMTKVFIFTVILCLLHVGIEGRVVNLLQSFDGPRNNYGFSNSFDRIFDTSKYGILQLNNGLAQTPQMGSVYRLYLLLCLFEFCGIVIFHFSLCLIKDHSYISCVKKKCFWGNFWVSDEVFMGSVDPEWVLRCGMVVVFEGKNRWIVWFALWIVIVLWVFCRWNSWNFFACNINETVIKETGIIFVDYLVYLLLLLLFIDIDSLCWNVTWAVDACRNWK